MKISERLTALELELKYIKKLLYVIIVACGGSFGIKFIPTLISLGLW